MNPSSRLSKLLLALIGLALLARQALLWRQVSFDELRFSALGSIFLLLLIWGKRRDLVLESGPVASLVGVCLIATFLVKSAASLGTLFTAFAPLLWGTGLALLASGFTGLRQYRRELFVLVLLVLPYFVRWLIFDAFGYNISPIVAASAAGIVRCLGGNAVANGDTISVPVSVVHVYQACSGLKSMFLATGFSVFLLLSYPPDGAVRKTSAVIGALIISFVVNISRVAFLVILIDKRDERGFHYWHTQDGALLFEILAIMLFVLFYRFVLLREPAPVAPQTGGAH